MCCRWGETPSPALRAPSPYQGEGGPRSGRVRDSLQHPNKARLLRLRQQALDRAEVRGDFDHEEGGGAGSDAGCELQFHLHDLIAHQGLGTAVPIGKLRKFST